MNPRVTVQQRNIPTDLHAESRVDARLHALKAAVGNLNVKPRMLSHQPELGSGILNRMTGDQEDAVAGGAHSRSVSTKRSAIASQAKYRRYASTVCS